MEVNLDNNSIGSFQIGQKLEKGISYNAPIGVKLLIEQRILSGVFVQFSNFYSSGPLFSGIVIKNNRILISDNSVKPYDVCIAFENPIDHWDDDTEVNYQFLHNNVRYEFSWSWLGNDKNKLTFNYIQAEMEGRQ